MFRKSLYQRGYEALAASKTPETVAKETGNEVGSANYYRIRAGYDAAVQSVRIANDPAYQGTIPSYPAEIGV